MIPRRPVVERDLQRCGDTLGASAEPENLKKE